MVKMSQMLQKMWWTLPSLLLLTGLVGGCAQTTVQPQFSQATAGPLPRPSQVIVFPFAVNPAQVTENQGFIQGVINNYSGTPVSEREQQTGQDAANALADELVKKINAMGLPAWKQQPGAAIPPNSLVVDGHFIDINEGNRLQRTVIGFGLGQATMDTEVQVYGPSSNGPSLLLQFETHANSGEMPGVAVTGPAGAAASGGLTAGVAAANIATSGVKGYMSSVGPMASRSANQAAQYLGGYFVQNGWIAPGSVSQSLY